MEKKVITIKGKTIKIGSAWFPAIEKIERENTPEEIAKMTEGEYIAAINEWLRTEVYPQDENNWQNPALDLS